MWAFQSVSRRRHVTSSGVSEPHPPAQREPAPESAPQDRPRYRQLSSKERAGAIAAGVVIGTVGFVAMFVTKNEAGVGVAILLGGVLLVLGIQGTQLGKVGGKDIGFELMAREEERRQEIAEQAEKVAEHKPAVAQALLEAYEAADPGARRSPALAGAKGYVYEQRVLHALTQFVNNLGFGLVLDGMAGDDADAKLVFQGGVIAVEIKYTNATGLRAEEVLRVHSRARRRRARGLIVVTNAGVSPWADEALKDLTPPVQVVRWNGDEDNANLINALHLLRARVGASEMSEAPPERLQ